MTYHKIIDHDTILRLHPATREDGSLIIDMLHGGGWWRTQPVSKIFFDSRTTQLENFDDHYPQEFLGRDEA